MIFCWKQSASHVAGFEISLGNLAIDGGDRCLLSSVAAPNNQQLVRLPNSAKHEVASGLDIRTAIWQSRYVAG
jgi:hypothetical protein